MSEYTPMMQQYLAIKEEAKDAFLFFRLGDFYEMFFEDAVLAARELEITLTGRGAGKEARIPMCGVPYHSAETYISRLIEKGYKVAICEQVEDPATAKGVVRREIVRVVTPGTVMEAKALEGKANNFIAAVAVCGGEEGLAVCDLTTGELYATSLAAADGQLPHELGLYEPAEIVGDRDLVERLQDAPALWQRSVVYTARDAMEEEALLAHYGAAELERLGPARRRAVSLLTGYLADTQKRSLAHVRSIRAYEPSQYMVLDPYTRRNLELTETVQDRSRQGSLLWLLDKTETAMGARQLRRWIDKPLLVRAQIEERLEAVDKLLADFLLREELRDGLKGVYDLERLVGRIAYGTANARDLNALKQSLQQIGPLAAHCAASASQTLRRLVDRLDACADLAEMIETVLVEDPPVSVREGGLIRSGYDGYLDELREASTGGKRWLAELEQREREATGIRSLKIGYNKVFGYYLEVTKANLAQLPEGRYERKQTLAAAERFVTPELKEKERLILEAEDKMVDLEYARFAELRDRIAGQLGRLQRLAGIVATIDVLQAFAAVSEQQRYCRPTLSEDFDIAITDGRHPVIEAALDSAPFVANSAALGADSKPMMLITGPNMAGKSTYMRQVALICVMAQIGCFVPAAGAELAIVDRIFTRIGAADDLIGGQSTFMVEMKDIQTMTAKATRRSLVVIDELGRGTSTGEGMAIAQAVIEYVHDEIGCKALVSTHFHELAHLEETLPGLKNMCMAVKESGDDVAFLRKLVPGAASTSYGIYCARLAGLPDAIIGRAYALLHAAEGAVVAAPPEGARTAARTMPAGESGDAQRAGDRVRERDGSSEVAPDRHDAEESNAAAYLADSYIEEAAVSSEIVQMSMFGPPAGAEPLHSRRAARAEQFADQLRKLDLFNMTPLQAMQWLDEMKQKLGKS
ncbi:DNA mismatch repair protein MutS [Paenibacillus sp. IB182496]|uniref:DNA mismatch repair protein MutS n=1 Tax=Paenibacillus sabuli TaxID=2772509 RepID=A0A927BVI7_9BACL|nr:DNA mismatch repair protein MutS [Paenibacillus sabuli]MBD2847617.1 DNA mismatch repair protein MutS [Paenibacillus sabuli]